jgi:hypothetical protein
MERVESVDALVERLGGPKATGKALATTAQNVVHWRNRKVIPARLYFVHRALLAPLGIEPAAGLFDFATEGELATRDRQRRRRERSRRTRAEAGNAGNPPL